MSRLSFSNNIRSLPKDPKEYATKDFWKGFHTAESEFEWYGSINDHYKVLEKRALKFDDKILNLGCGTSNLELDLVNIGYKSIHSIDIDSSVIEKKKQASFNKFSSLSYEIASVDNIPAENLTYDVIIDKGTMDALLPTEDMNSDAHKLVNNMLDECFRILKNNGRYIIITLAQQQVIKKLYEYTQKHLNIVVQVIGNEVLHNGTYFPAVIIILLKLPKSFNKHMPWRLASNPESEPIVKNFNEMEEFFDSQYNFARFANMCKKKLNHVASITITLFNEKNEPFEAKISVVDDQDKSKICRHYFVIVPPDNNEYVYNRSTENYKTLPAFMNADRIIICEFPFDDNNYSSNLINSFNNRFLTFDCDDKTIICKMVPEERIKVIYTGEGKEIGKFTISECTIGNTTYRRLFFDNSPKIIQSECIIEEDGKKQDIHNLLKVSVGYQRAMMGALELVPGSFSNLNNRAWRIAVLGVGGGSLVNYLYHLLTKSTITCVELEPELYRIATKYFGMPSDNKRLKKIVGDALEWLEDKNSGEHDLIFVDISAPKNEENDFLQSPPEEFVSSKMIKNYKNHLSDKGCIIMNIISTTYDYCIEIVKELALNFKYIFEAAVFEGGSSTNYIIFASNEKPNRLQKEMKIPENIRALIKYGKSFQKCNPVVNYQAMPKKEISKKKLKNKNVPKNNGDAQINSNTLSDKNPKQQKVTKNKDNQKINSIIKDNKENDESISVENEFLGNADVNHYDELFPEEMIFIKHFDKFIQEYDKSNRMTESFPISVDGSDCVAGFHYVTCNNYEDDVVSYYNPNAININIVI